MTDIEDIKRITIEPGDIVVIRSQHDLDEIEINAIKAHVESILPDDTQTVVLGAGMTLDVLAPL